MTTASMTSTTEVEPGTVHAPRPAVKITPPEKHSAPSRVYLSRDTVHKAMLAGESTLGEVRTYSYSYKPNAATDRRSGIPTTNPFASSAPGKRIPAGESDAHALTEFLPAGSYSGDPYGMRGYDLRKGSNGCRFWVPCKGASCTHAAHDMQIWSCLENAWVDRGAFGFTGSTPAKPEVVKAPEPTPEPTPTPASPASLSEAKVRSLRDLDEVIEAYDKFKRISESYGSAQGVSVAEPGRFRRTRFICSADGTVTDIPALAPPFRPPFMG